MRLARSATTHVFQAVLEGAIIASLVVVLVAGTAFAAKGGNNGTSGGKHGGTTYTGSFVSPGLVLLNSTDGLPHYGQQVTFDVTSNAPYYYVELDCSQNGTLVYQQVAGFFSGWVWSQVYTLQSGAWTGGGADCSAVLYSSNSNGSNRQNLATMSFYVYP